MPFVDNGSGCRSRAAARKVVKMSFFYQNLNQYFLQDNRKIAIIPLHPCDGESITLLTKVNRKYLSLESFLIIIFFSKIETS